MNLIRTIQYLRPGEEWSLVGEDYSGLSWASLTNKPTEQELEEAWATLETIIAWEPVRQMRDNLLKASDWTQLEDAQVSNKTEWATYRQMLRDVPNKFSSPQDVIWPTPPV